jgi:PAS domain S-box-containing protein
MAPTTALSFLLLGLGLALIDIRMRRGLVRPAELLALLPLIISLVSLVEYSLDLEFLFSFQKHTRMALHTTLLFGVLSAGLLLSRPDRGLVGAIRQGMITAIEQRIYAVFILSLFVLIMIGAASYFSAQDSIGRSRLVERGQQVRRELVWLLSTLQDVETGMRGYVITGEAQFLEPCEAVMREVDQHHHKALQALIIAPDQKKRLDTLDLLIQKCMDHARRVIASRKAGGPEQAVRIITNGEGKMIMDEIRAIVSLMDAEEVRIIAARKEDDLRSAARLEIAVYGGIGFALLMNGCAIFVIRRDFKRRIQAAAALRKSESSLSVTLHSIGDGVLVVDAENKVARLNPVAEHLTGWSEAEARGLAIEEVFRIVNEETCLPSAIPIDEVLATGLVKGLANHTILISRDGTERPIADSAAPIRDQDGGFLGVVMVFRDVTVERELEKTLRRFNEELEKQVQERTVDLSVVNESLRNSTQMLLVEKQRLEQACYAGKVALWDWDISSGSLEWSENVDQMLGYEPGGFPREIKAWEGIMHQEDLSAVSACLSAHLEKAMPYDVKYRVMKKDGTFLWWHDSGSAKRDEYGKACQMSGACTDITARERAEQAVRESRAKLEAALASMTDAVFISDAAGHFVEFNDAFASFHRFKNKAECAENLADYPALLEVFMANGELAPLEMWAVPRALRGETVTNAEYTLRRKDTGETWIGSYSFSPIRDKDGVVAGAVVVGRDITERTRAEEELRVSEERYKRLLESTTNYIYSVKFENGKHVSTTHGPGCVSTTGYASDEYKADPYLWYRMIQREDRQMVMERLHELLAGGKQGTLEHRIVHKNGTIRWVSDTLVPRYEGGMLVAYDGLVVDITERRRLQEVDVARLAAESANRAKSDFLANMSHELRTPLNSIIGFADILDQGLQGLLTAEQAESVRDISGSGRHLLSLINDILDLSKVEAGKMELEPQEVDIGDLARDSLIFFKEKALKHRLALTAEIDEGTGGIVADARKVKQVIVNLLSNAVKFTPDGGRIRVRVRRVAAPGAVAADKGAPGGEFVEIAVEDTGIGISPEDQKKLFQPFQQVQTTLTREFAGTGLGLSLCRSFAELHGGSIRVKSTPGRGSTFTFRLPIVQSAKLEKGCPE